MAPPILLSPTSTLLISSAFTTSYVASVYLLPHTRIQLSPPQPSVPPVDLAAGAAPSPATDATAAPQPPADKPRDRNHPAVIRARLCAVSLSSLASALSIPYLVRYFSITPSPPPLPPLHRLLGLALPSTLKQFGTLIALPLGLTASLFAGSLYITWLCGGMPGQRRWSWRAAKTEYGGWEGLRNLVVGPLTEEVVFRSCIVAVSALAGLTKKQIVFLSPLYFGIAHVHHAYETYVAGGRTKQALIRGVLQTTFQFTYTTLFGWYATFLYLRTGSILPPFLAHSFCNLMGLPPLHWALLELPERKLSLWGTYLAGIATFIYGFWRWTEPALYGGSLWWW